MKRHIINIDEEKCTGCGACVPDCPEGALQIIDGKARLVSDLFCDGLGACIGTCPEGALTTEVREAGSYDERKVMANVVKHGENTIRAHLKHLDDHGETELLHEAVEFLTENNIEVPDYREGVHGGHDDCGCAGSAPRDLRDRKVVRQNSDSTDIASELLQWPVQLKLLNPAAPCFENADLLLAADCVPVAYGNFHQRFMKDRIVVMFCPKLDPYIDEYVEKLAAILENHDIQSITVVHMEVPCCNGIHVVLKRAMEKAGKHIYVKDHTISIKGAVV